MLRLLILILLFSAQLTEANKKPKMSDDAAEALKHCRKILDSDRVKFSTPDAASSMCDDVASQVAAQAQEIEGDSPYKRMFKVMGGNLKGKFRNIIGKMGLDKICKEERKKRKNRKRNRKPAKESKGGYLANFKEKIAAAYCGNKDGSMRMVMPSELHDQRMKQGNRRR